MKDEEGWGMKGWRDEGMKVGWRDEGQSKYGREQYDGLYVF